MKKIGALWTVKSKEGKKYLNGSIELIIGQPIKVAVFVNDKKSKKEQPDFNIVVLEDKKNNNTVKVSEESIF